MVKMIYYVNNDIVNGFRLNVRPFKIPLVGGGGGIIIIVKGSSSFFSFFDDEPNNIIIFNK